MASWDLLLVDAQIATMRRHEDDYGMIADGALAVAGDEIVWLGARTALPVCSWSPPDGLSCRPAW